MEGSEKTIVPESVTNSVLRYCRRMRIDPMVRPELITYQFLRQALSATKFASYFENIPNIRKKITGIAPPKFSTAQKDQLSLMFQEIQAPFEKWKGTRKNFLSYSYTTYKSCELLGYTEFLPYLPLLKAPANLKRADVLWKLICEELKYEFVETII